MRNHWIRWSLILSSLLWPLFSLAERLPVSQYTITDGLAHGSVWAMQQDARGFLWLATSDGLSRFANETFAARNIEFRFNIHGIEDEFRLQDDSRRELFLLNKEAINNSARHAHCTSVEVSLSLQDNHFHLTIKDDGNGFDLSQTNGGSGLRSMQERVAKVGGRLKVLSAPGQGTEIFVELPSQWR